MIPYWIMFSIPFFGFLLERQYSKYSASLIAWVLILISFSLLIGLRHQVGGDWGTYLLYFDVVSKYSIFEVLQRSDPGYYFINWLAAQFGGNIYWVNVFCGASLMAGVISLSRRLPLPWLALWVAIPYLIIVVGMGYSRQSAALGFVMLGLVAFFDKKKFVFVFWALLALTFHRSAIIIFPLIALASSENRKWSVLWLGLISVAAGYLFVFDSAEALWENYVEQDMQSQGGLIRIIMNALPAIIFILFRKRFDMSSVEKSFWFWVSLLALVCIPLVLISSTATDRLALYFIPLQLVVFSWLPLIVKSKVAKYSIATLIVLYYTVVLAVWLFFAQHAGSWLPYKMILFID